MPNLHRGEIAAVIGGEELTLCLTLGALAELEARLGAGDLTGLAERFAAGRIFSGDAARSLRGFALGVGASALLKPAAGAALSLLLGAVSPAHMRSLVLNVGSDTLLSLLFAGIVAIIAGVLVEAADVAAENAQFV